jgi:formyltetrahydrofolate synthetase
VPYGGAVAKIKLDAVEELRDRPKAKYVVVSAIHLQTAIKKEPTSGTRTAD